MKLQRFDRGLALPEKWFVFGLVEDGPCDRFGKRQDYYLAVLRLPSYQLMRSLCHYANRWHQLALVFHGRRGFSFEWFVLSQQPEFTMTDDYEGI